MLNFKFKNIWVTAHSLPPARSLQSCPTLWPHRRQPTRLLCPWDSPGKNTGVGCHFLLQCMKVKSESEVAQSYPTLSDPMDCSPPGSSIHGIFQARVLEWGAIAFSVTPGYSWVFPEFPGKFLNLFLLKLSRSCSPSHVQLAPQEWGLMNFILVPVSPFLPIQSLLPTKLSLLSRQEH